VENKQQISAFKKQLIALQITLKEDNLNGESATRIVELDQSSVGRLSRMDAMQAQAMAQENGRRRIQKLGLIDAALQRIIDNAFGICLSCDEEIALKRLEFDPTSTLCIGCANLKENQQE